MRYAISVMESEKLKRKIDEQDAILKANKEHILELKV